MTTYASPIQTSVTPLTTALASCVGRDLRTPLHSMLGFLELLGMSQLDSEQRRTFDYIMGNADNMAYAADRLVFLCGLSTEDDRGRPQPFELAELLGTVASGTHVEIGIKIDPDVPNRLIGEQVPLRILLSELVDNAVKHAAGALTLKASLDGSSGTTVSLQLSVLDSGPGLTAAQEAFLSGGEAEVGCLNGGMGFFVVRQIVSRLGARCGADRLPSGRHSVTAHVSLGVDHFDSDVQPVVRLADVNAPARLRVLLIEDNAVNRILAQRQMKMLGHDLVTAERGEVGVTAASNGEFDVILMDRHLPDIDGVEATRLIRQNESASGHRRVPVVAVTADAMARNREECAAAGMDGFLTKPVDLNELRTTLLDVCRPPVDTDPVPDVLDDSVLRLLAETLEAPEVVAELKHAFLSELPLRRLRLQGAVRRSSAGDVLQAAEVLRASCETVGARRLATACREIAEAARHGDLPRAHALMPILRENCSQASAALS